MANDITLGEWLSQAQRSMGGGYFGRTSGPLSGYLFGPDFFRKATYLQISDTFTATYGKKVWDALNNKTVLFNAIKKVDWGPTVGWRLRTDRGTGRSQPVTETGSLPTVDVSNYTGVYSYPKSIVSTFGVSLKGQAVSALEGGIGNQFAVEQEASSRDHVKEINMELLAGSAYQCVTTPTETGPISGTSYSPGVTYASMPDLATCRNAFRIGDTVALTDATDNTHKITGGVISYVEDSGTATILTITTTGVTPADGDLLYIRARNGLTAIDDVTMACDIVIAGTAADKVNPYVYNLIGSDRTAGTYAAGAGASYNAGTGRALSTTLVDTAIQTIRENGGEPKLIATGLDQYDNFNQLLQSQQRFVDVTDYIVGVGDERTYPGTRAGFQLATYRGIPILPDPDTAKSVAAADTVLGSNFYVLDTDYLELAVMYPTQYIENRDYFAAGALVIRGMFVTMMELRALRIDVHYKISDLNA